MEHYTYIHQTSDTGRIFYIGKGKEDRAFVKRGRNQYWHNIVNKHGYTAEILAYWNSDAEAIDHEKLLIASFRDMGYKLANITDGGEGLSGHKHSLESRKKMSEALKGKKNPKLSIAKKGINPFTIEQCRNARLGKKMSENAKNAISEAGRNRNPISEETRAKLKKAAQDRAKNPEWIKKMQLIAKSRSPEKQKAMLDHMLKTRK
jgi:hypothetical protein